jgi:hypothetical protein
MSKKKISMISFGIEQGTYRFVPQRLNFCATAVHNNNNNNNNNNNKDTYSTHKHIAEIFNKLIEEDQIPEWLTAGVTFLIPKNEKTENPKNYRPVTCLPTMYKLITSVISRRKEKYIYIYDENLIPKEQKECYRGSNVSKDQLLISKAILQECKR